MLPLVVLVSLMAVVTYIVVTRQLVKRIRSLLLLVWSSVQRVIRRRMISILICRMYGGVQQTRDSMRLVLDTALLHANRSRSLRSANVTHKVS